MNRKWVLIDLILLGTISVILCICNIRVCPFYFLFKIPCPGCGLSRGFIELFKLNFLGAVRYNILTIPLFLFLVFYFVLLLLKKQHLVDDFLKKHKVPVIILAAVLTVITFIINLNNPLLY